MQIDPADALRLDVLHALGTSATGASFATSSGDVLEVQCYGAGAFRLRVGPAARADYAIVVARPQAATTTQSSRGAWTIAAGDARLDIASAPLAFRLLWKDRLVLCSATDRDRTGTPRLPALGRVRQGGLWSAAFALATGEPVYGLGEKFGALDKRGQLLQSRVEDAQDVNTARSGTNTPFAWSVGTAQGAWGVYVHTPADVTHAIGHPDWSHRSYALVVEDDALDVFVFAGDQPASILDLYTQVTGRPAPVPRWSLGLALVRAHDEAPDASALAGTRFRERRIPADVVALEGDAFGDFAASIVEAAGASETPAWLTKLRERAFRLCLRESAEVDLDSPLFHELASQQYLLATDEGEPYICARAEGDEAQATWREFALVDFTHADAFAWWRDAHASVFEAGIDVVSVEARTEVPDDVAAWNGDAGSRLSNAYALLQTRCAFEATARYRTPGGGAPAIFATAGWTGSQRSPLSIGPFAQPDWEGLAATLRGALSSGMSGIACYAATVGAGFGDRAPPELFVRWLQAAVFLSHLRLAGGGDREPWLYGADAEGIARKWLTFRYRLIPYLEQAIADATRTGMPVARAMPLAFPESRLVRDFETQFMCGDALLVAPILREGGEIDVALPPGAWYDLNTRARYAGSQVLRYAAKLDQFPVFGREGYALPLGRGVQHTGEIPSDLPLEALWVFGKPVRALEGFRQARVESDRIAGFTVRALLNVDVQVFGDAAAVAVLPM
ncbi:MAG TPA: TIM-barrel domain-containing protein [Casimicrobiaceae bacterium]|nr:TIM-barrel domain-containing protein [Casimicrobiaceae bacterium]